MTTKQIDYCIGLAHTLNFSRAADNMFVSQPTFSYQIRLLQKTEGRSFCICPLVYTDINKGTDTKGPSPRTIHKRTVPTDYPLPIKEMPRCRPG